MRRRLDVVRTRAVVEIRDAQRLAARIALEQAGAALREAEAQATAGRKRLEARQAAWAASVEGASLDLSMSQILTRAVDQGVAELAGLESERQAAERGREAAADGVKLAEGRMEAAEVVARAAARRLRRHEDELAVADAAERFSARQAAP